MDCQVNWAQLVGVCAGLGLLIWTGLEAMKIRGENARLQSRNAELLADIKRHGDALAEERKTAAELQKENAYWRHKSDVAVKLLEAERERAEMPGGVCIDAREALNRANIALKHIGKIRELASCRAEARPISCFEPQSLAPQGLYERLLEIIGRADVARTNVDLVKSLIINSEAKS